jgi:hypothetical protein
LFDRGGEKADLARAELFDVHHLRSEHPDAVHFVGGVGAHHADALASSEHAVDDANEHHDAEIAVVPAVDQQRLERRIAVALGRGQARDDPLQHLGHVEACLRRDQDRVGGVEADHVLDLLFHLFRLGGRQVDLVEDGHDLVIVVDRLIHVGERLRLHALGGIDHQKRAFAGGERAVDLVGKVDVARRIDQVEDVVLAVARAVIEPHGLRLDGDAAFALDVHGIEHLLHHLALGETAGRLDQAIGQRRLAVVDMRDDGEVADVFDGRIHGARISTRVRKRQALVPRTRSSRTLCGKCDRELRVQGH